MSFAGKSSGGEPTATPLDDANATAQAIADRLASLGTLVASVAHEVNNPITYVLGNLGELERLTGAMREAILSHRGDCDDPLAPAQAELKIQEAGGLELLDELFADVYEGAIRIRDLVRDLLSLSRPPERVTDSVNVHEILDSTLRLASRQIAQVATLEVAYGATRLVPGDRARLGGVFLNLIRNAVHACQPPDSEQQRIRVSTRDEGERVVIEVQDTGVGVPPEQRERVFDPFFTTKDAGEGTGLGLFISRRIVEEHGGSLSFRDAAEPGTIFAVELPAQSDQDG